MLIFYIRINKELITRLLTDSLFCPVVLPQNYRAESSCAQGSLSDPIADVGQLLNHYVPMWSHNDKITMVFSLLLLY